MFVEGLLLFFCSWPTVCLNCLPSFFEVFARSKYSRSALNDLCLSSDWCFIFAAAEYPNPDQNQTLQKLKCCTSYKSVPFATHALLVLWAGKVVRCYAESLRKSISADFGFKGGFVIFSVPRPPAELNITAKVQNVNKEPYEEKFGVKHCQPAKGFEAAPCCAQTNMESEINPPTAVFLINQLFFWVLQSQNWSWL